MNKTSLHNIESVVQFISSCEELVHFYYAMTSSHKNMLKVCSEVLCDGIHVKVLRENSQHFIVMTDVETGQRIQLAEKLFFELVDWLEDLYFVDIRVPLCRKENKNEIMVLTYPFHKMLKVKCNGGSLWMYERTIPKIIEFRKKLPHTCSH